jgi:SPP1 gp7 family putative phage head morphogenesis protein
MKISERRKNLIKSRRAKKDLRGRIKTPDISDKYRLKLKKLFEIEINKAEALVKKNIFPLLPSVMIKLDANNSLFDRFEKAFRGIFIDYFGGLLAGGQIDDRKKRLSNAQKIERVIKAADRDHKKDFNGMMTQIANVQPLEAEKDTRDYLELSIVENTNKITTVSKEYFSSVQDIVMNGLRSGVSNKSIIKEMEERITSKAKNYRSNAKLIATDQIQKLNGQLDKVRQVNNGGSRYIWRTRRNQAVRDDHQALDGAILEWGNPPVTVTSGKRAGERNEPGQDINCKCQAEMVIEDMLGERTNKIIEAEKKTEKLKNQGRL